MKAAVARSLIRHLFTTSGERPRHPADFDKVYDAEADTLLMFMAGDWHVMVGPPSNSWRSWN